MKFQKRHIVLAALVLALGAAVFINWQFSDESKTLIDDVSKELGAATYVNADVSATNDEVQDVAKKTTSSDTYFAKAQTERQQARDEALEIAKETLNLADSTEDARTLAVEQLNKLEDNIVKESNIESILKGKGYSQCLCFLSDDTCTVTVLKSDLKDNSPLIIKDVVLSQTDVDFNSITIIDI